MEMRENEAYYLKIEREFASLFIESNEAKRATIKAKIKEILDDINFDGYDRGYDECTADMAEMD
jgi:uncharacterized protein (UPF0335 family)